MEAEPYEVPFLGVIAAADRRRDEHGSPLGVGDPAERDRLWMPRMNLLIADDIGPGTTTEARAGDPGDWPGPPG
jgi:hypothetical protein